MCGFQPFTVYNTSSSLLAGAVASMFWVDAELGSDIYLDGKIFVTMQVVLVL